MTRSGYLELFGRLGASAVALSVVAAVSSLPVTMHAGTEGMIRLSWRALGREVELCRALSPDEIARQPAHMRRTEECRGRVEPYRLTVSIDGTLQLDTVLHAAGARGDRPIYVLHDLPVASGERRVDVSFTEIESPAHRRDETVGHFPEALSFHSVARIRPGTVLLITYEADRRALVARSTQQ
jgi:hypothetical protein